MQQIGAVILIVGILFLVNSCEKWKYNECKKVGHGTAYYLYSIGNK